MGKSFIVTRSWLYSNFACEPALELFDTLVPAGEIASTDPRAREVLMDFYNENPEYFFWLVLHMAVDYEWQTPLPAAVMVDKLLDLLNSEEAT